MGSDCAVSNIWPANRPFSQSETELRRTQLNEVGSKLGDRSLNTTHVWPRRTAPRPDGLDWEPILRTEETGVRGENPRSQVEIDWNSTHITTCVVEVEGVIDFQEQSLYKLCQEVQRKKSIQMVTHPDINPVQQIQGTHDNMKTFHTNLNLGRLVTAYTSYNRGKMKKTWRLFCAFSLPVS